MGVVIFGIILVWEVIFAAVCIVSSEYQNRLKNIGHIGGFGVVVILCMAQVVQLSFRWYILGVVLLIGAIWGCIRIIRPREAKKVFKKRKIVLGTLCKLILAWVVVFPAIIFPQYQMEEPKGPYLVAKATYTFEDESREDPFNRDGTKRKVNVALWYPKDGKGKYPLVVFDHGAYGVKNSNLSVYLKLASEGYVVCAIDHPGHSFYTQCEDGTGIMINKNYSQEVTDLNTPGKYTNEQAFGIIQKWMKLRTEDINFTIDTLLKKASQEGALPPYQLIDQEKIGLFGHSMGAAASVAVGRMRQDIDAVINIDGPYFTEVAYDLKKDEIYAKKETYTVPILNIYSDQVWRQLKDGTSTGVYAANKSADQICTQSSDLYLEGAKHLTLTDLAMISPALSNRLQGEKSTIDLKECREKENNAIVEFFNYNLRGKK